MKMTTKWTTLLFSTVFLLAFQFVSTPAQAQSSYFTSRGCVDCHSAPTVATCAGCHEHSGTLTATKNKTTSYSPGETVTITLTSSGARAGWVGVRLYNQSGVEIARSTGNQSGMGGSATFGAASAVSAPAPATAGSYTWRIAYLGNENGDGSGDVHSEISVNVPITVASAAPPADTAAPVVTFTLPATATSLTVSVSSLSATDNVAVTGYLINKIATPPAASATGWTATAPTSVTAVAGSNTFYAWAKDAAGNVSAVKSASVIVTIPPPADTTAPVVTFSLPATATSLTVPVSSLSATDNVAITGYLINKIATPPAASAAGWTATAPTSVTAVAGSNTFYAWAKDAAGNVSAVKSATVVVSLPDTAAPVVSVFTLPATSTSLNVPVASFTATDNVGVNGYQITSSATAPTVWSATAPTSVTAAAAGNVTFYAWAKDAAGNVSLSKSASVVITLPDTTLPVVSAFTLPATSTSLNVPVASFTATDNVGVNGYQITSSAVAPTVWSATAPTSVTAAAAGNVTFYAWAKDAAGNVSLSKSASVVITLPDTTLPVVSAFTLPATSTSLNVPVASFTATDNVGVNGYQITSSATAPTVWSATAPTSVTAAAAGNVTFYAWAKDAAGNVSLSKSATVVITLPAPVDTTLPVVSAFTLPATSTSLNVPVASFTATDNVGVNGYQITSSAVAPTVWSATAPTSVTAAAAGNVTFYAWAKDAAGNVSLSKSATVVITLPAPVDTTLPVVSAFTLPATSTSLNVPVASFTATDNVGVNGYQITSSAVAPTVWSATAPTSVTAAAAGNVTFYAWAKDAAGNVSLSKSASVVITLPAPVDTTLPVVSAFTLPATATSLTIPVASFTATDNVGVTGYQITNSATAPTTWSAAKPTSVTAAAAGNVTFYAWAKDAAGNVSLSKSASVVITLPAPVDTTLPVVSAFTLPATATSLTIPVSSFTATDNVGVTGYQITNSATAPTTWSAAKPTSVTAGAAGSVTFYAWAKDAAGNVSLAKSASVAVTISTADITKPTLTISTLADGSSTNNATLNVSGSASDAGGLQSVTVNGQSVTIAVDGSFSIALPLAIGDNNINVVAADKTGNQTVIGRTIKYDPNAPILAVTAPTDNSLTTNSFITISGTVSEVSTVTVKINNTASQYATLSGNAFSAVVYLVPGLNTIDITAVDPAGNISSAKRTVTYESNKPTLAVTSPNQDITTSADYLILRGTAADAQGRVTVRIVMDGNSYYPTVVNGAFAQKLTFRYNKLYAITVTARDAAGNRTTVVRNVIHVNDEHDDDEHDDDDDEHDDD